MMVPFSPTKRNAVGADVPPWVNANEVVELNTIPVGFASPRVPGGSCTSGTVGLSDVFTPFPSYRVDLLVWLSATQKTPFGLKAMPHEFFRLASTCAAWLAPSDTSPWTV